MNERNEEKRKKEKRKERKKELKKEKRKKDERRKNKINKNKKQGLASTVEERLLCKISLSKDRDSNPP